jgi:hypothetical protein
MPRRLQPGPDSYQRKHLRQLKIFKISNAIQMKMKYLRKEELRIHTMNGQRK